MKKRIALFHLSYYFLSALVYIGFFYGISFVLNLSSEKIDLGTVIAATYFFLFIGTPVMITVIMRFSLLKWYVDPFAAAEIPLLLYIGMIITNARRTESIQSAFFAVNGKLCDDGGMGGGSSLQGFLRSGFWRPSRLQEKTEKAFRIG